MAHTKASATTKGNRDSVAKRLGIKLFAGEKCINGNIIVRQRGTKVNSGPGTRLAKDYTIYAVKDGTVAYKKLRGSNYVSVQ